MNYIRPLISPGIFAPNVLVFSNSDQWMGTNWSGFITKVMKIKWRNYRAVKRMSSRKPSKGNVNADTIKN